MRVDQGSLGVEHRQCRGEDPAVSLALVLLSVSRLGQHGLRWANPGLGVFQLALQCHKRGAKLLQLRLVFAQRFRYRTEAGFELVQLIR